MRTPESVEAMTYTQILDTLNRCRRLALRFSELRDQVDGLLLTGTKMTATYTPQDGGRTGITSDPVFDHIQRLDALQSKLDSVWSEYKCADYRAMTLIKTLRITERERDILDTYYRGMGSPYMIAVYFEEASPPINNADDLDRARKGVLRKLRRSQFKIRPPKAGLKKPRHS